MLLGVLRKSNNNNPRLISRFYSDGKFNEAEIKVINKVGVIELNKPKQLNCVTFTLIDKIRYTLKEWERNENVKAILIKGKGPAFSAGGDLISLRKACLDPANSQNVIKGVKDQVKMNYEISCLKKPYIAFMNGITMGGGVGLSVHGRHPVATEKTIFAMPEVGIGYFPDVGSSYFFSRLKDKIGLYLALTGNKMRGQELKKIGLARYFVLSESLPDIENALYESNELDDNKIRDIISRFDKNIDIEFDSSRINKFFDKNSVEEIIENLEKDKSEWSSQQLKVLRRVCPTSVKVTFNLIKYSSDKNLKECLEMEYQLGQRFMSRNDLMEGIRVTLMDKGQKANWNPAGIKEVDQKLIDWFFTSKDDDSKLFT